MPKKQKPPLVGVTAFAFRHDRVCKYTKGTGLCAGTREHGLLPALVSQIYFSSEITSHILGVYYPVDAHSCDLIHFAHELYGRSHALFRPVDYHVPDRLRHEPRQKSESIRVVALVSLGKVFIYQQIPALLILLQHIVLKAVLHLKPYRLAVKLLVRVHLLERELRDTRPAAEGMTAYMLLQGDDYVGLEGSVDKVVNINEVIVKSSAAEAALIRQRGYRDGGERLGL